MKELKDVNFAETFSTTVAGQNFFDEMKRTDKWVEVCLNECSVQLAGPHMFELKHGSNVYPIHPMAMKSIETISEGNAQGNYLYTDEEYVNMLSLMFSRQKSKKKGRLVIRGGSKEEPGLLIGFNTIQYQRIDQADLFESLVDYLGTRPFGYTFVSGSYDHMYTKASFILENAITDEYKDAWRKAGLDESLLDRSEVYLDFSTNDIGTSKARVVLTCKTGGDKILLGEPIDVWHRVGGGSISTFEKRLENIGLTISEEMNKIAELMNISIFHPESTVIRAINEVKLPSISKKACKELVEEMFFSGTTSAYVIYLFLHGIINTEVGASLSEERKFRLLTAIRGLLTADWSKLDKPGAATLA